MPEEAFFQELTAPATTTMSKAFKEILLTQSKDWRQLIIDQINNTYQAKDESSAVRMEARARSYTLIDGVLYKKGVVQPLLMHNTDRRQRTSTENTLRHLQIAHRTKGLVSKGHKRRFLLAHLHQGCQRHSKNL